MPEEPTHISGRRVGDGEPMEWWIADGTLHARRGGDGDLWVIEGGLVDAHVHLTFEPHDVFGLPRGSDELIAAGLQAHRDAGELILRDVGSLPGVTPDRLPGVIGAGPFLAPPGHYFPHLCAGTGPKHAPPAPPRRSRRAGRGRRSSSTFPRPGRRR